MRIYIMKIINIKKETYFYEVTLSPNMIERFFGVKTKIMKFKKSGQNYLMGGQNMYIRDDGQQTVNGSYIAEALDKFNNKF